MVVEPLEDAQLGAKPCRQGAPLADVAELVAVAEEDRLAPRKGESVVPTLEETRARRDEQDALDARSAAAARSPTHEPKECPHTESGTPGASPRRCSITARGVVYLASPVVVRCPSSSHAAEVEARPRDASLASSASVFAIARGTGLCMLPPYRGCGWQSTTARFGAGDVHTGLEGRRDTRLDLAADRDGR